MKIGDTEVPDGLIEDALKKSGQRIVTTEDYIKKSEAAADLAKFRAVTGDSRSVDEIGEIIKKYEETERKSKSQAELLQSEVKRLQAEQAKYAEEAKRMALEVKRRDLKDFFAQASQELGLKVIEPIMSKYRAEFEGIDETKVTREDYLKKVAEAITKASEEQNRELQTLGLGGSTETHNAPAFGAGMLGKPATPAVATDGDVFRMLKESSLSGRNAPFAVIPPPGREK